MTTDVTDPMAPPQPSPTARPGAGKRVALFATCANDVMFPQTPKAVVLLLERLGCEVVFPQGQTCCGQAFINTGYFDEAVPVVRNYVKVFADQDYIVGPSGSCVGAVRHQHEMLGRHAGDEDWLVRPRPSHPARLTSASSSSTSSASWTWARTSRTR